MPNPAFIIIELIARMKSIRDMKRITHIPGFNKDYFPESKKFINELISSGKISFHMLTKDDRALFQKYLIRDAYTPLIANIPCLAGSVVLALAAAIDKLPSPASLEKIPFEAPILRATINEEPTKAPVAACPEKAL